LSELEDKLANLHGREYAIMLGNATMGIALSLKASGIFGKKVAIPNNVCINVPMAVIFSGNELVYIDICRDDFGLDPERLAAVIEEVDAAIAVHAYGYPCKIKQIERLCSQNDVLLIEDLAVAQGAEIEGVKAGGFGDISIVSFGAGKIIDVGHGGAILTDDRSLFVEIERLLADVPIISNKSTELLALLGAQHTKLYNLHYRKTIEQVPQYFNTAIRTVEKHFQYKYDNKYSSQILIELDSLKKNLSKRINKYNQFADFFYKGGHDSLEVVELPVGSAPWRYNLLVKKDRDSILRKLIQEKKKISSWHPSVDLFLKSRKISRVDTPVSDWLGDTVLNMWINHEADDRYIRDIYRSIRDYIEDN